MSPLKKTLVLCGMAAVLAVLCPAFAQAADDGAAPEAVPVPDAKETHYGTFSYYAPLISLFEPQVGIEVQEGTGTVEITTSTVTADDATQQEQQQEQQAAAAPQMTLRYKVLLLDRENNVQEVTDKHRFHSGDRIRLVFESNIDGYLYIYQQGASGRGACLFPDPRINNGANSVRQYRRISVPPPAGASRGWWRFDKAAGDEELYLFLSPEPIAELASLVPAEGGFLDESGWQVVTQYTGKASAGGAAKVYYEEAGMDGWDYGDEPPQAYVVTQTPVLVHHLTLRHEK